MATSKDYLAFVSEQLSGIEGVSFKPMMGEYLLYFSKKIVGGIYDDRLLIKPTDSARRLMPDAQPELPYEGAKAMLLVDRIDDKAFLARLLPAVAADLPEKKR